MAPAPFSIPCGPFPIPAAVDFAGEGAWKERRDVHEQASPLPASYVSTPSHAPAPPAAQRARAPPTRDSYPSDMTQGPSASISAGAGAIARVYAPFYEAGTPPSSWGQTARPRKTCGKTTTNHRVDGSDSPSLGAATSGHYRRQ